ncbi:MAG: flagellar filament capping protein FliD, partial [bacterium]
MPGTQTISGYFSGLDTNSIMEKLREIKNEPVKLLENKQTKKENELSAWGDISTKLLALKAQTYKLRTSSTYISKTGSSSDEATLTVSVGSSAVEGIYTFTVNTLANNHLIASNSIADKDETLVADSGSLTIQVGDEAAVEIQSNGSLTLEGLRDLINNSEADVTASVVNVGEDAYRLLISGNNTGAKNSVSITNNLIVNTWIGTSSSLVVFDTANPVQAAQDATITIGSGAGAMNVSSSTNQIRNVMSGVSIDLLKVNTSTPVNVKVEKDITSIKDTILSFVDEYNNVVEFFNDQFNYDQGNNQGGVLLSSGNLVNIQTRIQNSMTNLVSGSTGIRGLFQLSISSSDNGTLSVNEAGLTNLLKNDFIGVRNFLLSGLALRVDNRLDDIANSYYGTISTIKKNL